MAKLAIYITDQPVPDVENGTVSVVAESMGSRLRNGMTNYHPSHAKSHKIVVSQDRYLVGSPKSHERKGASTPPAYELRLPTTLQPREQIMRSTTNKKVFLELLSKCPMREEIEKTGERL